LHGSGFLRLDLAGAWMRRCRHLDAAGAGVSNGGVIAGVGILALALPLSPAAVSQGLAALAQGDREAARALAWSAQVPDGQLLLIDEDGCSSLGVDGEDAARLPLPDELAAALRALDCHYRAVEQAREADAAPPGR